MQRYHTFGIDRQEIRPLPPSGHGLAAINPRFVAEYLRTVDGANWLQNKLNERARR